MMKFKSLFRRSQQGHQKQHRRLRHNNNNSAQPQASSTISLFKEQPHRCEGAALAAAPCWGSVTTLTSPSAKNHPAKNNQTLPKDFDRMQRLDPDVHANDKILVEKHKTELMWLKEQHRIEMEHLTKEIENLRSVLRSRNENSSESELQATIQELNELQNQFTELQADNERLNDEKGMLLDSLCRQTGKLEDSRNQVGSLQEALLLKEENAEKHAKGYNTEREQKLVDLLKSAQEERETLLQTQDQLKTEIRNLYANAESSANELNRLTKKVKVLENDLDGAEVDKQHLDRELRKSRQEVANLSIEMGRLNGILDSLRAKIAELEKPIQDNQKSLAEERLDTSRREKELLENQVDSLRKQLMRAHCDNERIRSQLGQIQDDFEVFKATSKSSLDDLEKRLQIVKEEKSSVSTELQLVRDSLSEWQAKCQRYLDDARELKSAVHELQRREREAQARHLELEETLRSERETWKKEREEWQQFQTDLLMTVRVANDFKTEAQNELERVLVENQTLQDNVRSLEVQLEKFKNLASHKNNQLSSQKLSNSTSVPKEDLNTELLLRRKAHAARQDSRLSVKCLIESIENATKQAKTGTF